MAFLALAAWLLWHVRRLSRPALAALVVVTIPIAYINAVELNYGNGPALWLAPLGFWGVYGLLALYAPDGFRRESTNGVEHALGLTEMNLRPLLGVGLGGFLIGCTLGNYSVIDGNRITVADPYVFDVVIVGVDGQMYPDQPKELQIAPGLHLLHLASTKENRFRDITVQDFPIDVAPCTRYRIVAKHSSPFDNRHWSPVVEGTPLPGCSSGTKVDKSLVRDFSSRVLEGNKVAATEAGKAYRPLLVPVVQSAMVSCARSDSTGEVERFAFVAEISADGTLSADEYQPQTATARCFAESVRATVFPRPPSAPYPLTIEMTVTP
jgi:hypothetical protein